MPDAVDAGGNDRAPGADERSGNDGGNFLLGIFRVWGLGFGVWGVGCGA